MEKANAQEFSSATVQRSAGVEEACHAEGVYHAVCRRADGSIRWEDHIDNLVTTQGKNFGLDTIFGGAAYTAAWYMQLISSTSYTAVAAGDTAASHAGWLEAGAANAPTYSQATRPAPVFSAAASGSKATSAAVVFSISGSGTVKGCAMGTSSVKGGTGGVLYSAGLFAAGDKLVGADDTLSVTYTAAL